MGLGSFGNLCFSGKTRWYRERARLAREEWTRLSELISSVYKIQRRCVGGYGNSFGFNE